ncbi:hypothetical protein ACOSQ2_003765 [Xanthoceras sorbifolium]
MISPLTQVLSTIIKVQSTTANGESMIKLWINPTASTWKKQSMARILQLRQQLQQIKKGRDSVSGFIMKIKNIGDALIEAREDVPDRDLILALLSGVGHIYDVVVVMISSQHRTMSLEDAQFLFLMYEQRIDQLNSTTQLNVASTSTNFAVNQPRSYDKKGQRNGGNTGQNNRGNGRGRNGLKGGRYQHSNQRIYCQLFSKSGHGAIQCYKRFD